MKSDKYLERMARSLQGFTTDEKEAPYQGLQIFHNNIKLSGHPCHKRPNFEVWGTKGLAAEGTGDAATKLGLKRLAL